MFVVVASRFDVEAAKLVERWHDRGARLLTCDDLSRRGWIFLPAEPDRSRAVLGGEPVPVGSLRGVLSLLPRVAEFELTQIVLEERAYVAAEMMAFLLAWLASLPCPVLNRPTPLNLTGPSWHPEQWHREAMRAGLPTRCMLRSAPGFSINRAASDADSDTPVSAAEHAVSITVIGEQCFLDHQEGPVDEGIAAGVRHLAAAARVELLTARFVQVNGTMTFVGAEPRVDLSQPGIADRVMARLGIMA